MTMRILQGRHFSGGVRTSQRKRLRLSLVVLATMSLLSACGAGGGSKPGVPSSDVTSRRSAGNKTSSGSTGNRGASSPGAGSSGASSPIQITDSVVSADVTVSVEPTVGSTSVMFKYKLTNDSSQTVWAVHSPTVSVIPDGGRKSGVVAAMAFFPVRRDVNYVQPPYETVVKLEPKQTVEGSASMQRPFNPYDDLEGDKKVALPSKPTSIRLCIGYVAADELPAGQPGGLSSDKWKVDRDIGYRLQRKFACSKPTPLE